VIIISKGLRLVATGDSVFNMRISFHKEEEFLSLINLIREGDVRFTNFEIVICDYNEGYPAAEYGVPYQVTDPAIADELKWMGFNLVSRANNHTVDWSYEGIFNSSRVLDERGIVQAGVGHNLGEARSPAYLETEKGRVALISSASSFPSFGRAGEARFDVKGRPGLNPLRFQTEIRVTKESLAQLKSIIESVGAKTAIGPIKETSIEYGRGLTAVKFVESDKPELYTSPYEPDLQGNIRSVKDARRMADLVFVTHHGHEDNGYDRYVPAKFIETYARACIDAGADAFLGHGPHIIRGVEIYKGKPILYSMGNIIFQYDTTKKQGQEWYDRHNLGIDATPADAYDANDEKAKEKTWNGWAGFPAEPPFWDTYIADMTFDDGKLIELKLHPATTGYGLPRTQRGCPKKASPEDAARIIEHISKYSVPYGTKIEFENGTGIVRL
jgi:poly-gamma-glutamate capsule biosynthesis protein CapA/YwtB (metallophosphatase superfamily)